jgi:hypothetical protein
MSLLTHLLVLLVGLALGWAIFGRRAGEAAETPSAGTKVRPVLIDDRAGGPMDAEDAELDARIFAYVSEYEVYHINDVCVALEHPKGARFVRTRFHRLMERGEIVYRDLQYRV